MGSFLLPVQPLSFGTAETESLYSFYSRVAILHGYGSSQLLRALRGAFSQNAATLGESRLYTGNGLNGSGQWVRAVATLLEKALARTDLSQLTLFALPAHVPRNSATVRAGTKNIMRLRNWCEMCFMEDANRQIDAHDRLLWSISYIKRCPFHRVRLRATCPTCCQPQRYHNMSLGLAYCYSCESSLIGGSHLLEPDLSPHYGEQECIELVSALAAGDISSIAPDVIPQFYRTLTAMCAPLGGLARIKARVRSLSRKPRNSSTLSNLIEVSIQHQVSIVQLATSPDLAAKWAFGLAVASSDQSMPFSDRSYAAINDDIRILMEAGLEAADGVRIPTLAEISTMFRLRAFHFRLEFPDLAQRYITKVRKQAHLLLQRETGQGLIRRLATEGKLPYLTDGEVQSMLEEELDLSQSWVKQLLAQCRRKRRDQFL